MTWPQSEAVARRTARAVVAAGLALLVAAVVLDPTVVAQPWIVPTEVSFVLGGLIVLRRPTHAIGWLFLWYGAAVHLTFLLFALATVSAAGAPGTAAWLDAVAWAINTGATALYTPLGLLLFPTGRLPSRRWAPVAVVCVVAAVVGGTAALLVGAWGGFAADIVRESPLRTPTGGVGDALSLAFFPLLQVGWVGSAVSLVLRVRRARGEERQQLRLLGLGAGYALLVLGASVFLTEGGQATDLVAAALIASAMAAVPVAASLAVLRYRLWDIDVVIRRSVLVALLAGFVTAVYAVVVVGVGRLLPIDDLVLSVAATGLVAVLFAPLRGFATRAANRLVYGRRATPFEVLADLAEGMAGALPADELLEAMARRLADGTGAARTAVWLRTGDTLVPAAGWPTSPAHAAVAVGPDGTLPQLPDAEEVTPVSADGRLLGALTVTTARGDGLVPAERALLNDLAASAGLVLRRVGLDRDLQARAEELAASRRRVVAAEDAARTRLERDLHDGAQQQLVALKVQLGLARTLAAKEDAPAVAARLPALTATADILVDAVRAIAHGIHPPLLTAEGLGPALAAAARRSSVPIALDLPGHVGRYSREVEAGLYVTATALLEAVVAAASLRLTHDRDRLTLTCTTDTALPTTPALTTAADRLDTLHGTLTRTATTIEATVPLSPTLTEPSSASAARATEAALG